MKTINYTGSSKLISRIVNLLNRKAPLPLNGGGDPDWGTNGQVLSTDGNGNTAWVNQGGGGSGGHTIESTDGTDLPQEDNLQFVGVYTEDDSANDRTKVNIVRQMTKAAMQALSSAEKEGFIDTTDEDDDYIPIDAEDVKYGGSDVKTKLDSLTTEVSGKVSKTGDTMTGLLWHQPENTPAIRFRAGNASYRNFITQYTGGNEALVHATKNAITSLIFVNGEDSEAYTDSNRWMSLTPGLQIKNNKVAIGKLIGNGVTPTYTLDVGGTINASSTITQNGTAVMLSSDIEKIYVSSLSATSSWQTYTGTSAKTIRAAWANCQNSVSYGFLYYVRYSGTTYYLFYKCLDGNQTLYIDVMLLH